MVTQSLEKALRDAPLTEEELAELFDVPLFTDASGLIIAAGRRKAEQATDGLAEVHAQVGVNISPCPKDCRFCSFAAGNRVFEESMELSPEQAVERSVRAESDGANCIYLMITATYPFEKFMELAGEVRKALRPETPLVGNVSDFTLEQARRMKDTGLAGVYHAVRLGEGVETKIPVEQRLETMRNAREAGLLLGTCLEPVGPEHTTDELVEKTIIGRDARPVYSGSARRIPVPGTEMGEMGIVSKARMAHIVAVVRLAMPLSTPGNCTHEPDVYGSAAGASLLWAEAGANPRDTDAETEGKHGMSTSACLEYHQDAGWQVLDGPSRWFSESAERAASEQTAASGTG